MKKNVGLNKKYKLFYTNKIKVEFNNFLSSLCLCNNNNHRPPPRKIQQKNKKAPVKTGTLKARSSLEQNALT